MKLGHLSAKIISGGFLRALWSHLRYYCLLLLHPVYPGWCPAASTTTRWRSWWRLPPTPTSTTTATWSWPARSSPWPRPEQRRQERCPQEMSPHSTFDDDIYNMIFILNNIYLYWQRLVFNKCCNHKNHAIFHDLDLLSHISHYLLDVIMFRCLCVRITKLDV